MKTVRLLAVPGALAMLLSTAPTLAWLAAQETPVAAGGTDTQSEAAIASQLARTIRAQLAQQPETASAEDLEAIIVFVAGQGNYSDAVIGAALDQVAAGQPPRIVAAVENARRALLKRRRRGTGAITGEGSGGFGAFSAPGVAPGGGGANYQ